MKNIDQIRAHNAIKHAPTIEASQGGGDAISGFPMLVLTDGLLAALAFACEYKPERNAGEREPERKHRGEHTVAEALTAHLSDPANKVTSASDPDTLVKELAREPNDIKLRRATAESLAYLSYLKRFVRRSKKDER